MENPDCFDVEFHSVRNGLETTKMRVTDLKSEMLSMKREMIILKQESDAYLTIRRKFFAMFRRDSLKSLPKKDKATSREGNNSAHGGDLLVDLKQYEKQVRFDDDVFIHLYGSAWQRAESYREEPEVSDPRYAIQDLKHLKECFAKFIILLQVDIED